MPDEGGAGGGGAVEDAGDELTAQGVPSAGFTREAGDDFGLVTVLGERDLRGDERAEAGAAACDDEAHAAFAEAARDFVLAVDGVADVEGVPTGLSGRTGSGRRRARTA
jgi:hypothetical protein